MTLKREIQSHLEEMYGAEVSPTLISSVTDAVMDEAKAWQAHPLDALLKLFYLALANISKKWTMPLRDWKAALTRFTIQLGERMPKT